MNNLENTTDFKQKYQDFFAWAAPFGLLADFIAIWGLFDVKQKVESTQQFANATSNVNHYKILGIISISDAIVLTGFFTLLMVISTIYFTVSKSHSTNLWPSILGGFVSLVLVWSYLRLWLGEHGWLWVLLAVVLICLVITIMIFSTDAVPEGVRIGCVAITLFLLLLTAILFVALDRTESFVNAETPIESFPVIMPTPTYSALLPTKTEYKSTEAVSFPALVPTKIPEKEYPFALEEIHFEAGAISYNAGASVAFLNPKGYKLYVLAGQQLKVFINQGNVDVAFWDTNKLQMTPSANKKNFFEVSIPVSGYYVIGIYGSGDFNIKIEIPPLVQ